MRRLRFVEASICSENLIVQMLRTPLDVAHSVCEVAELRARGHRTLLGLTGIVHVDPVVASIDEHRHELLNDRRPRASSESVLV